MRCSASSRKERPKRLSIRSATCCLPRLAPCATERRASCAAEELVPGDIVLLESGDRIPADIRLIEVKNLRTDEAALTGESVPADKVDGPTPENSTVGDRENYGVLRHSGRLGSRRWGSSSARAQQTELGRINQMLAAVNVLETPLLRQIKEFGHTIAKVIGVISVLSLRLWAMGA